MNGNKRIDKDREKQNELWALSLCSVCSRVAIFATITRTQFVVSGPGMDGDDMLGWESTREGGHVGI